MVAEDAVWLVRSPAAFFSGAAVEDGVTGLAVVP